MKNNLLLVIAFILTITVGCLLNAEYPSVIENGVAGDSSYPIYLENKGTRIVHKKEKKSSKPGKIASLVVWRRGTDF